MKRTILKVSAWTLAIAGAMLVALLAYLSSADLGVYKDRIEAFASNAIGLELEVGGRFELEFGGTTRLVAEDLSLANREWQTDPELIRVGRLSVAVDLWSLLGRTFVVESLEAGNIRGRLEFDGERRSNWSTGRGPGPEEAREDFDTDRIAFREVRIEGLAFSLVDPERPRPIDVALESVAIAPDAADVLDIDVRGTVNELPLAADGRLGPWQNFVDGRNITADLDLGLGAVRLSLTGSAEDLVNFEGIDAEGLLTGPDVGRVIERLGLPPFANGDFQIDARVDSLDGSHRVMAEGRLGEIEVRAGGAVDRFRQTERAELNFSIAGPDLEHVAELFGVAGAPAEAFRVSGDLGLEGSVASFAATRLVIGGNSVSVDGSLDFGSTIPDGRLALNADGPDFSVLGPFIGVAGLPREAFSAAGELQKRGDALEVKGFEARVGAVLLSADGAATLGRRDDSEIVFRAEGPDISILEGFTDLEGLPARPFVVSARLRSDPSGIAVHEGLGEFGDNRIRLEGVVSTGPGLAGTALSIRAEGPELQDVAVLTGVPHLPAGSFDVASRVSIGEDLLSFEDAAVRVGDLTASGAGEAGLGDRAGALSLDFELSGPDAAQFVAIDWLQPFAGEAFSVAGGLRLAEKFLGLRALQVGIGEFRLAADGELSLSPAANDSDVEFSVAGPSLATVGRMFGADFLVDRRFDVSGRFTGTPSGFAMRDFVAKVGDNDLHGDFSADLRGKPRISGKLVSDYLDLRERIQMLLASQEETGDAPGEDSGFVFSDEPIDGAVLQAADLDINVEVARLRTNTVDVTDFLVGVRLQDGSLRIDPFRMNERGGSVSGMLSFSPGEGAYTLDTRVTADELHLGLSATADQQASTLPAVSGKIELLGSGASLHQIMASSNGAVSLRQGSGEVREFAATMIFRDVFLEALRMIDVSQESRTVRRLECGIYDIDIADGVATLRQVAMQTDRLLLAVSGDIDLETENLNVNFRAKPREGLGVSLGAVANSFLGVRGTLKAPRVTIDPKASVTATGAAVATGGLSLLARSMWDRFSAEKSICDESAPQD